MERDLHLRDEAIDYTEIPHCTMIRISFENGYSDVKEISGRVILEREHLSSDVKRANFVSDIFVQDFVSEILEETIDSYYGSSGGTNVNGGRDLKDIPYRYYLGFGHKVSPMPYTPAWGTVWIPYNEKDTPNEYEAEKKKAIWAFIENEEKFLLDGYRRQQEIEENDVALRKEINYPYGGHRDEI